MSERIGLLVRVGSGDEADLVSWFALRVARAELRRRLPGAHMIALGPDEVSSPLDGGEPVRSVGRWTPERRDDLAAQLDCVVVMARDAEGGDAGAWPPADGLGPEHELTCPTLTLDPGVLCQLVPRVLDPAALDQRLAWLRLLGWHPAAGRTVVLVCAGLESSRYAQLAKMVTTCAATHSDVSVLLLESPPPTESSPSPSAGDSPPPTESGVLALQDNMVALPSLLSLEDIAAVIRSAVVVVGAPSEGMEELAAAYGRQFVAIDGDDLGASSSQLGAVLDTSSPARRGSERVTGAPWASTVLDAAALTASRHHQPVPDRAPPEGLERLAQQARGRQLLAQRRLIAELGASLAESEGRGDRDRAQAAVALAAAAAHRTEVEGRLAELRHQASEGYKRWESQTAERAAELGAYRAHVDALTSERDGLLVTLIQTEEGRIALERELVATHATALFRYTALPRRVYGALRRGRA